MSVGIEIVLLSAPKSAQNSLRAGLQANDFRAQLTVWQAA